MNIFSFKDYRPFLRSFIDSLPQNGRGEVGRIAARLGVHSSLVSQVLSGSKDFSLEQTVELVGYLGLNSIEAEFFILLVQHSKAGSKKLKDYIFSQLEKIKKESLDVKNRIPQDHALTDMQYAVFYSSWLYAAIWLYTSVGAGQTVETVSVHFDLTRSKASRVLNFLYQAGLCKIEKDRYVMGPKQIHLEKQSPFLAKHHGNWRIKATQRAEDVSDDELMFTAPVSLSKKDFLVLREQLMDFIKSASTRVEKSNAEELACLNLDLFFIKK